MATNSRQKGKRGEREAAEYLRSLGFADAQRTQQYNGLGESDVICPQSLPGVHIEVKYGYPLSVLDLGTLPWCKACDQAARECETWPLWCVLWRPLMRKQWRCTFYMPLVGRVTCVGNGEVTDALRWLRDYRPEG